MSRKRSHLKPSSGSLFGTAEAVPFVGLPQPLKVSEGFKVLDIEIVFGRSAQASNYLHQRMEFVVNPRVDDEVNLGCYDSMTSFHRMRTDGMKLYAFEECQCSSHFCAQSALFWPCPSLFKRRVTMPRYAVPSWTPSSG